MKRIAIFISVFLICTLSDAQNVIKGTVTDEHGKPMAGVNVVIDGSYIGTVTGYAGTYELRIKKEGNYSLSFSFIGYEKIIKTVSVGKEPVTVNVKMEPSVIMENEVVISAIKANKESPVAYSEISKKQIGEKNYGQDMPYIFDQTPGVVVTSDAGAGIGYTSFRIRGTDITRINVTINGIPLNDAESQGVYFVDMPDFAASVDEIQIQRGVGTSTNGTAAFGASVNLSTLDENPQISVLSDNSYGSFNSWKNSVSVSSGLLPGNMAFDVRLSRISSDGFIDRASSNLKSYYLSGGYYGKKTTVRFITFSGTEKTYQAWYGVPKVKLENDMEGMQNLVLMAGWSEEEAENLYSSNPRTFNKYIYENQTDNYKQSHYQLHYSQKIKDHFNVNAALHYTKGAGYYESYKYDKKFTDYGFGFDEIIVDGDTLTSTDLIQQKWLDNDFYGLTFSGNYDNKRLQLSLGGAYNYYDGDHYGKVIWTEVNDGSIPPDFEWYRNTGTKGDFNIFVKAFYNVSRDVVLFGDVQYRHVNFDMTGTNDDLSDLTRSHIFNFANPKAGLSWNINDHNRIFASFGISNREPTRTDFKDAPADKQPKPERLNDYEFGYSWKNVHLLLGINLFYMDYTDQLVLTGEINNVGVPIMVNVPDSYRKGIEISGDFVLRSNIRLSLNASFSSNKINDFTEYVDNWSYWDDPDNEPVQIVTHLGQTDISFSPEIITSGSLSWKPVTGLTFSLLTKYVGKQYIDNTSSEDRKLDPWFVSNLIADYELNVKDIVNFEFGLKVNNLFNEMYESNAWVYQYYYDGEHEVMDGYFPQAGTNFLVRFAMRF